MDAFTQQQTRLVIIIDGLDSCEQDKILLLLDAVRMLFSEQNTPFIIILAIDPHAISQVLFLLMYIFQQFKILIIVFCR